MIGDEASPVDFQLDGCRFYSLFEQRRLDFEFAHACPVRHYARKNIGYLLAIHDAAPFVVETDDDSDVYESFWATRQETHEVELLTASSWVNIYRLFGEDQIWPRGLPLDAVNDPAPNRSDLPRLEVLCPVQQGLVDDDPDVDALYRLLFRLPYRFEASASVALGDGAWCPFNSQNTSWWPRAFPLLYLPAYCSFRMTDIWRSLIAQRIAWVNGWSILFHASTLRQQRNVHDLMRDFADEIPGYLHNRAIATALDGLSLRSGEEYLLENLRVAYECLVGNGWLPREELTLVDAWSADVAALM